MSANELRIGNVLFGGVVCEITENYFVVNDGCWKWKSNEMVDEWITDQPIKLTEEWLLKFGFKKWGRNDLPRTLSYEYGKIQIFPSNPFCDFIGYGFMHYKPNENKSTESARFKFQYVHQLQNLYFALTGEELTIKEA